MALIKKIPDYQQGKIYKLINHELPNLVYYGSTTQTLNKRLQCHKDDSKRTNNSSKIMFSIGCPEIILLEYYPCETKQELEAKEREWIEGNECVNHYIPGRTQKETIELKKQHYQDNKEIYKLKNKKYRQDNNEKIKEKRNEKRNEKTDCECGGKYIYSSKSRHIKSKKHIKFISLKKPLLDVDHEDLPTSL